MSSAAPGGPTNMTIDATFTAVLQKSPTRGGWTYVVWPKSAACFVRRATRKEGGQRVTIRLEERLP
jgi:hypothetical protein